MDNKIFEDIWKDRYRKDNETYEENLSRVAHFCANNQEEEQQFFDIMRAGKFFPGGRTMSNAGIGTQLTLNNCFVAPQIEDDLGKIFDAVKLGALTHQRGGGIGYDFSNLRPTGTPTSNDAIASGPVSFANVFNAQTATILQGNRRGANMGVLNIYHPDIEEFINAKSYEEKTLNHFNLSVMVDDLFMAAVENDSEITLHWPVYNEDGQIERNESKWKITKQVKAKDLWDLIMQKAYNNGEPGIFFYDNMNRDNNLYYEESIVCSNPCAEYLSGTVFGGDKESSEYGGACNLGSLMLHKFVVTPFKTSAYFNFAELQRVISIAVRLLDNIIDKNSFPSPIYKNYQERYRTIGLGYTGLADALVMLGFSYNSVDARNFVSQLTEFIAYSAYEASIALAIEKGAFPGYDEAFIESNFLRKHIRSSYYDWVKIINGIKEHGIRNAKLISVAPTGTMSLVFGNNCSSGIEPIFSLEYDRKVKIGGQSDDDIQTIKVKDYAYGLYQELQEKEEDVIDAPFITALDMSVDDHIQMLISIAYNVDMSVSKTINVPNNYPFEKCKNIYKDCWLAGIKGCTIFRPNELRLGIFLTEPKQEQKEEKAGFQDDILTSPVLVKRGEVLKCSDNLVGVKRKLMTGCGSMHLMAWYDPETLDIMEVFVGRGSSGGCEKNLSAITRLISVGLRGGVPFEDIIDQLESCGGCSAYNTRRVSKHDTSPGSSCATAIARALVEINEEIHNSSHKCCGKCINKIKIEASKKVEKKNNIPKCPECGEELSFEGGCNICKSCGWSKCG